MFRCVMLESPFRRRLILGAIVVAVAVSVPVLSIRADGVAKPQAVAATSRKFLFRYHVTLTDLPPNKTAHVWIPLASSDAHQQVTVRAVKLPGEYRKTKEKKFGNAMYFVKAVADKKGRAEIAVDYEIVRKEVTPPTGEPVTADDTKRFLQANRLVPLGGKPLELFPGKKLPGKSRVALRMIYDRVDEHVRYDKPAGGKWGRGDATWVCDSRFGNCSDFHSLFISLCRSSGVPARFHIGFPISGKPRGIVGGYHCWAECASGGRWFSVDISEADKNPARKDDYFGNLPPDRVMFSTGRDLVLNPKQKAEPLNFFVYPHVEVDGKVYTKMTKQFSFENLR